MKESSFTNKEQKIFFLGKRMKKKQLNYFNRKDDLPATKNRIYSDYIFKSHLKNTEENVLKSINNLSIK